MHERMTHMSDNASTQPREVDMQVTLQLPAGMLFRGSAQKLRAVARTGSFGILPNHADLVAELVPSVLILDLDSGAERFFGIDEGLLVKRDRDVSVAVRRGVAGDDLGSLHEKVRASFMEIEDEERAARAALTRLEADMVRRLGRLNRMQP